MQILYGLFSLESAEAVVAELERDLGPEAVNLIAADSLKERLANGNTAPTAPGTGGPAPAQAPALRGLLSRKRPIFLGESGSVYAINALAAHVAQMAQSQAPTKRAGSLRVAFEEFGVNTFYSEAYTRGVQAGYVLVFAEVPDERVVEMSNRWEALGGREVFLFQRLD
jgi:hypothetical protein